MTTSTTALPARPVRAERPTGGLRLTRRGRLAAFVGSLVLVVGGLGASLPAVVATDQSGEPAPVRMVTVETGDTLWDIAARANPGGDVTDTAHEVAELNHLSGTGQLTVGQELAVPVY